MFNWLFNRELSDVLNETKRIRVQGVPFVIKKVDMLNYLEGSKVLIQAYDTHKTASTKAAAVLAAANFDEKKRKHYADVLVAGIVSPKVVYKKTDPDDKSVCVDQLFVDWNIANRVYDAIMYLTYGKKKVRQAISVATDLLK